MDIRNSSNDSLMFGGDSNWSRFEFESFFCWKGWVGLTVGTPSETEFELFILVMVFIER